MQTLTLVVLGLSLALTADSAEVRDPVGKPILEKPMRGNSTMPTMRMVLYWRLR